MAPILHDDVSGFPAGPDATKIDGVDWDADHTLTAGSDGQAVVRDTSAASGFRLATISQTEAFRDLLLRTHPDDDQRKAKAMLVKVAELVLNDGMRVTPAERLVCDLSVAGIGGLDTGSETASKWYREFYARKKSDGSEGLLFSRAKEDTQDEAETTDAGSVKLRDTSTRQRLAQGFQVDLAKPRRFVVLKLQEVGAIAANGRIWVQIESDSAGSPSGTALATSDKLDATILNTTAREIVFPFRTPFTPALSTQYHYVLYGDWTVDAANHAAWRGNTVNSYSRGVAKSWNGTTWAAEATVLDFDFRDYALENDVAPTFPTGYNQSCFLGYFYNDASGDLVPQLQIDRWVRFLAQMATATFTETQPTLRDLSAILPPVPVFFWPIGENNTDAARTMIAPVPDGFGALTDSLGQGAAQFLSGNALAVPGAAMGGTLTELQRAYTLVSAGTGRVYIPGYRF